MLGDLPAPGSGPTRWAVWSVLLRGPAFPYWADLDLDLEWDLELDGERSLFPAGPFVSCFFPGFACHNGNKTLSVGIQHIRHISAFTGFLLIIYSDSVYSNSFLPGYCWLSIRQLIFGIDDDKSSQAGLLLIICSDSVITIGINDDDVEMIERQSFKMAAAIRTKASHDLPATDGGAMLEFYYHIYFVQFD